jgi:hypothetical protein
VECKDERVGVAAFFVGEWNESRTSQIAHDVDRRRLEPFPETIDQLREIIEKPAFRGIVVWQDQADIEDGALAVTTDVAFFESEIACDELDPFADVIADEAGAIQSTGDR